MVIVAALHPLAETFINHIVARGAGPVVRQSSVRIWIAGSGYPIAIAIVVAAPVTVHEIAVSEGDADTNSEIGTSVPAATPIVSASGVEAAWVVSAVTAVVTAAAIIPARSY